MQIDNAAPYPPKKHRFFADLPPYKFFLICTGVVFTGQDYTLFSSLNLHIFEVSKISLAIINVKFGIYGRLKLHSNVAPYLFVVRPHRNTPTLLPIVRQK